MSYSIIELELSANEKAQIRDYAEQASAATGQFTTAGAIESSIYDLLRWGGRTEMKRRMMNFELGVLALSGWWHAAFRVLCWIACAYVGIPRWKYVPD